MVDIFLSYAHEDVARIQPIAGALERQGWTVFWDQTIPAGRTWRDYIGSAIASARCVVVAWSKCSVQSSWVQEEAEHGRRRGILVPILLDDVEPPFGFGSIQAASLAEADDLETSPVFMRLVRDLARLCPTAQTGAPTPASSLSPATYGRTEVSRTTHLARNRWLAAACLLGAVPESRVKS